MFMSLKSKNACFLLRKCLLFALETLSLSSKDVTRHIILNM